MLNVFLVALTASASTILQVGFFSHLGFPWSTFSFPLVVVTYGVMRDRPLLSLGWSLVAGFLLDLHGFLGFGAETAALFSAFFFARFLFRRVLTDSGSGAIFLLGAATASCHRLILWSIDAVGALFRGAPLVFDLSSSMLLSPFRQGIVNGLSLLLLIRIGAAFRARFRKIFLSHETTPIAFS